MSARAAASARERGPAFPCAVCRAPVRRSVRAGGGLQILCPRCRYRLYDYPRPCVGFVVVKNDAVLLLRRGEPPKKGWVDLPGGFLEPNEDPESGARRELREETGLMLGRADFLGLYWDTYGLPGFGRFPTMNFYWIGRWRSGVPRAGDDAAFADGVPISGLAARAPRFAWAHMRRALADARAWTRGRRPAAAAPGRTRRSRRA